MDAPTYLGVKLIRGTAMSRQEYNDLRGWRLPDNENGEDAGYLVEYLDGGAPNLAGFDGYVSWSPADVFDRAYRPTTGLPFGLAVEAMKLGRRVARRGWNGNGMFAYLVPAASYPVQTGAAAAHFGVGSMVPYRAYLALKTTDGDVATWAPSASDALADDWFIVE
jgi:hypothetical protein